MKEEEWNVRCPDKGLCNRLRCYGFPERLWKKIRHQHPRKGIHGGERSIPWRSPERQISQPHLLQDYRLHERKLEKKPPQRYFQQLM